MQLQAFSDRVRAALPEPAARLVGPAYRRARREWQWRSSGADFDLAHSPPEACGNVVFEHRSVLLRELAGLDMRLQHNKIVNLQLAVEDLDGRVLRPGQRLSFWRLLGKPTARRGFLEGLVLREGRLTAGVGGGLCQLTNLIHWMTLHTELTVVERWRHSYDVFPDNGRTVPFASGATCAYPSLDLQIENRTLSSYRLGLRVGPTDLEGAWTADYAPSRTFQVYEAAHVITNDGPGIHFRRNVLRRRILDASGAEIDDELITHNHARMRYAPMLPAA